MTKLIITAMIVIFSLPLRSLKRLVIKLFKNTKAQELFNVLFALEVSPNTKEQINNRTCALSVYKTIYIQNRAQAFVAYHTCSLLFY
jgi:hypothetical protein